MAVIASWWARARRVLTGLGRAVVVASLVAAGATLVTMGWFRVTDQQVLIVTSGSMAPVFNAGDAVIVHRPTAANLVAGTIISFHAPASMNRLTTHRIKAVYRRTDGVFLQTKGDHNKVPDPDLTPVGNVTGVMAGTVPVVGRWLAFYSSATGKLTVLGLPLLLLTLAQAGSVAGQLRPTRTAERPPDVGSASAAASGPRSGIRRRAAGAVVLVVLVAAASVGAGKLTGARFLDSRSSPSTLSTRPYFTCSAAVLAAAPYLYYKFDETSGTTATDSSGNGRSGAYNGTVTKSVTPAACTRDVPFRAVTLNGTTGYVGYATSFSAPNTFTLEVWFKTATTTGGKLMGFGNAATGASTTASIDRHMYLTNTGKVVFGVHPSAGIVTVTSPLSYNDNTWHQATATLSTAGLNLYLDGAVVATSAAATTGQTQTAFLRIGYDTIGGSWPNNPNSAFLTATIDDAAFFTTALTATTIANHYLAGR
jgi:signal peptidase I